MLCVIPGPDETRVAELKTWLSGIESAIGALQAGNGLKRCREKSELGFGRYLGLAVLGRNLHVLGKLLIAKITPRPRRRRQ